MTIRVAAPRALGVGLALALLAIPAPAHGASGFIAGGSPQGACKPGTAGAKTRFSGVDIKARLISIDPVKESATIRINPQAEGSYTDCAQSGLLSREVVLYTNTLSGSVAHNNRPGAFMDPFETTVALSGDTSDYPFHHLKVELQILAATAGGVASGKQVRMRIDLTSGLSGYRMRPRSILLEKEGQFDTTLGVDLSAEAEFFAVFVMAVMWLLALSAIVLTVTLVRRRRRFEAGFTGFLAALLFAFPTVRNTLPGIPPVGVLFDYVAFFWAEALVGLALVAMVVGWALLHMVGTGERR